MDRYPLWINGEPWDTGNYLTVTDKATGSPWATVSQAEAKEVDAAVTAACHAFTQKPLTAMQRYAILTEAGLPPGWLNFIVGPGDSVGHALLNDTRIGFYTFTGSKPVGEALKRTIGLRRCTLELGSNSAVIVHEDANIANAATQCALKGFSYSGQVCLSVQRILVHRAIADEFTAKLVGVTEGLRMGDPK